MDAISHAESKTWCESNFIANNSKWLQGNVLETEKKLREMVKILEGESDSFAQRAIRYYTERPELIHLAKQFYGAYCALAERYDVAAGALRVATRSLAEGFPKQTPPSLSLPDEPANHLSEPQTPEIPPPARSLFEPDELHKDTIENSPKVHKKYPTGLKEVNNLFSGEPLARKSLSFEAEKAQKVKHETVMSAEIVALQKDVFHLSEEAKFLKDQVLSEAGRANKAEGELLTLKGNILHLSFEKDAACIECQNYLDKLWESNFVPKNSKWLQGNVSETEKKVRKMVKILEVDADSFAQRANKYYSERPELMHLAEEFYRAYHALAERYDVAAGALRVATRSLAEAFPNQTPPSLSLPDEPSTPISEPQTPEILPPARSLFESDKSYKDTPNVLKKNKKGFKQVNDLFQGEHMARKGLSFEAEKTQKVKHETGMGSEMAALQRDIFHLSEETKRLKDQVLSEAERANKAEGELLTLKGNILHLSFEKDAACIECQSHSERLANVESELAQAHSDLIRLRDVEKLSQEQKLEVELLEKKVELQVMELEQLTEKLQEVEKSKLVSVREVETLTEQNLSSEMTIRKLQGKIGVMEETMEKLKREIQDLQKKLHEMELDLSETEEVNKCLKEKLQEAEATVSDLQIEVQMLRNEREKLEGEVITLKGSVSKLKSEKEGVQRDLNQLKLEMAIETDMLRNAEKLNLAQQSELELLQARFKSQEQLHRELVREIGDLNEQKITSEETITELSRDLTSLKQTKERLEKEVVVHLREKETLQKDLSLQIQDTCDLANKLQILTAQTEAAIKVNAVLKEAFTKYEIEKGILLEKNVILEKELSDAVLELELLKERISELEVSEATLTNQISVHVSEKADLASYFSEIYVKNSVLESSLFEMSEKLKASEASCQSLISQKSGLVTEKDGLLSQTKAGIKVNAVPSEAFAMSSEAFAMYEIEKGVLSEKNVILEKELADSVLNLGLLKERISELEVSETTLAKHISVHFSEKSDIASHFSKMYVKNSALESSFFDISEKLKASEASCQSLISQKSELVAETDDLLSRVESMTTVIKSLEEKHKDLEEKCSVLSKERDFKQNQMNKLQEILSCKTVENELQATSFQDQIKYLSEKNTDQFSEFELLTKKLKNSEVAHQLLIDQVQLLEEQFKAPCTNLEAENNIECRTGGLRSWLNSLVAQFFHFFDPVKYHMVKYICSIKTILFIYWSFSAVRFLSKQGIREIDSSQSKSRNKSNNRLEIKDGIDGDFKVGRSEMENPEEIFSKRERIKKITKLRQEELGGIFFLSIPIFELH